MIPTEVVGTTALRFRFVTRQVWHAPLIGLPVVPEGALRVCVRLSSVTSHASAVLASVFVVLAAQGVARARGEAVQSLLHPGESVLEFPELGEDNGPSV